MSTSSLGRSTSSFIKSKMFVPPAKNCAPPFAETVLTAVAASVALVYLNGLIFCVLLCLFRVFKCCRIVSAFGKLPHLRLFSSGVNFLNCRDDVRIRAAATKIPAHSLADFIIRELNRARFLANVRRHVTRLAVFRFREHRNRRANLSGRAVAALKTVVF